MQIVILPQMQPHERRVAEMMSMFEQDVSPTPRIPDEATRILRARLTTEETLEFVEALGLKPYVKIYAPTLESLPAELGDDDYVIYPIDWEDVHIAPHPGVDPVDLSLASMCKEAVDISVVNTGFFLSAGVRMEPLLELVDSNNILKAATGTTDAHGKFCKHPDHPKADVQQALLVQGYSPALFVIKDEDVRHDQHTTEEPA